MLLAQHKLPEKYTTDRHDTPASLEYPLRCQLLTWLLQNDVREGTEEFVPLHTDLDTMTVAEVVLALTLRDVRTVSFSRTPFDQTDKLNDSERCHLATTFDASPGGHVGLTTTNQSGAVVKVGSIVPALRDLLLNLLQQDLNYLIDNSAAQVCYYIPFIFFTCINI